MRIPRVAVRLVMAMVLGVAALAVAAPSPAHADNPYWVETKTVTLGDCSPTWNNSNWWDYENVPPGIHFQFCVRKLGQNALGNPTYQGYTVISNSGTAKHYVQVSYSLISSSGVGSFESGGCYTTALYSKQSLTCRSSTVTFGDAKGKGSAQFDSWFAVSGWKSSGLHIGIF